MYCSATFGTERLRFDAPPEVWVAEREVGPKPKAIGLRRLLETVPAGLSTKTAVAHLQPAPTASVARGRAARSRRSALACTRRSQ